MLVTTMLTPPNKAVLEYDSHAVILPEGEVLVGRGPECTHRVDDPNVSRQHVKIRVGRTVTVEDLGSTNGTFLNGMPVRGIQEIEDGDELSIGGRTLRLRVGDPSSFVCDETTPVVETLNKHRGTLYGLGAVSEAVLEQTCPTCGPVAFDADTCPKCGVRWPRGKQRAPTDSFQETTTRLKTSREPALTEQNVSVHYVSERLEFNGTASDLCEAGLFIATTRTDPVGTTCRLVIIRPGGVQLTKIGFVQHVIHRSGAAGKAGMGIAFGYQ